MEEKTIDRAAMWRLAKALVFVCGPDHPIQVLCARLPFHSELPPGGGPV